MNRAVPVLMYHSIAPRITGWVFDYLSVHPDVFEDHIATLKRSGYTGVFLADLYRHVSGEEKLPPKAVVVTLDDGYLDNWVFAFPLLRKYGFKATIFVSTDFIDPRNRIRRTLDDVWQGRCRQEDLVAGGFLGLDEMKAMLSSGIVDIQAHCRTHTWYFSSRDIVDFHSPGDAYPWLAWNARPERKHLYIEEDQSEFVPFGSPVYTYEKSLVARRYFPDAEIQNQLVAYVEAEGGRAFFDRIDGKNNLFDIAAELVSRGINDRFETQDEYLARLKDEIASSKQNLEEMLGKPIDFLCWPGGAYNDKAVEVARAAGFRACTLGSRRAGTRKNRYGEDPSWIRRVAVSPWWYHKGRQTSAIDGRFLKHIIEEYMELPLSGTVLRWHKLVRLLRSYFRKTV